MKYHSRYLFITFVLAVLASGVLVYALWNNKVVIDQWRHIDRVVRIYPDYSETVSPPNIAPLNFLVKENGSHYYVKIYSKRGQSIEVFSKGPKIAIPRKPWHKLLDMNREQQLYFDVFVKTENGQWNRYQTISNTVANEDIDAYIAYRLLRPQYNFYKKLGIYQRNLESYKESVVLDGQSIDNSCVNCHSFANNNPESMTIGMRSKKYGNSTLL